MAHLYRDPEPPLLIKQHAPRLGRWVERMSTSEPAHAEYLPEISAHVGFANHWLDERPDIEDGTNGLDEPASRGIGSVEFPWRGITIRTEVTPYRFWLMQRLHDAVAECGPDEQSRVRDLFRSVELEPLLDLRTARRVGRNGHLEVWGPVVVDG